MTIKAPTMLIADLDSCWAAGMAYVMLGRVQNINQLILRWTYDPNAKKDPKEEKRRQKANICAAKKLKVNEEALAEAEKISQNDMSSIKNLEKDDWLSKKCLKITSLNIQGSLQSRLADLDRDRTINGISDIICLQEIGTTTEVPPLNGYTCCTTGGDKNKGVAIFVRNDLAKGLRKPVSVCSELFQGLKLSLGQFDVITVYRSPEQSVQGSSFQEFTKSIAQATTNPKKPTILCGDFNFDRKKENNLTRMLSGKGFKQIVLEPTTYRGNCIDHVYHDIPMKEGKVEYKLLYPYYSDHQAVCVMVGNDKH